MRLNGDFLPDVNGANSTLPYMNLNDAGEKHLQRPHRLGRDHVLSQHVTDGIDKAPETLCRLLAGENRGKTLIRVGPEPGEDG